MNTVVTESLKLFNDGIADKPELILTFKSLLIH